eukprot:gene1529-biopygen1791
MCGDRAMQRGGGGGGGVPAGRAGGCSKTTQLWTGAVRPGVKAIANSRGGLETAPKSSSLAQRGNRGHGAGVARAKGIFLAWGGAGMARAWRGHVLFPQGSRAVRRGL